MIFQSLILILLAWIKDQALLLKLLRIKKITNSILKTIIHKKQKIKIQAKAIELQ
jgi:hypothetical protein